MRHKSTFIGATVVALLIGMASFFAYNLWFRPPPRADEIRDLLIKEPFIGVVNTLTDDVVLPPSSAELQVNGIYPYAWGVVTTYYNRNGQGAGTLERGFFGWNFRSFSWGPRSAMSQKETILYNYQQEYVDFRRPFVEVVYGIQKSSRGTKVRVVFDNGSIIQQDVKNGSFSISSAQNGGACKIEVLDTSNATIEEISLTPRIPYEMNNDNYDCAK